MFKILFYCLTATNNFILPQETYEEITPVSEAMEEYLAKGGTFIRMEGSNTFKFQEGDVVFPACSGGQNRSQTTWALLHPYSQKLILMPPHATQYGLDPINGEANWLKIKEHQANDQFEAWAGFSKSEKFGWDLFPEVFSKKEATPEVIAPLKAFYDQKYYNPTHFENKRRVYITFQKNAHIHVYRLNQTNTSLKNVVVLCYPLDDLIKHPLPEWNTLPGSIRTYQELSKLIKKQLDLSDL